VTLNGKPFTGGAVTVVTEDGKYHFSGRIQADGTYRVERAPVGKVRIGVVVPPSARPPGAVPKGKDMKDGKVAAPAQKSGGSFPASYSNPETSGLVGEIRKGEDNVLDIAMQSQPPR
jgi:hypothetical protein